MPVVGVGLGGMAGWSWELELKSLVGTLGWRMHTTVLAVWYTTRAAGGSRQGGERAGAREGRLVLGLVGAAEFHQLDR